MSKSFYLISPRADAPSYYGLEVYAARGLPPATTMADLTITTVAAMVPADFAVRLCDESISPIDFDTAADFVGITGKSAQWGRMQAIAREFRSRGRVVVIGGPYASLCPEIVRPHCDILVRGELEDIATEVFSDLRSGHWCEEYIGNKPDLCRSPVPRWDKYRNDRALAGSVQTSRGCPFECEFCDVIQYLGRKQRHKPIPQILNELDVLYRYGYRSVFLCDDNFTVYRARTKETLQALRDWNLRQDNGRVRFLTQLSIDAARDDELLRMCAEAGLTQVFIGIETPNEDSLRETKKRQNMKINLADQVQRFLDYGISVGAGMIVGFDADGPDIFQRQFEFAMSTPIPIFSAWTLLAPPATPLYERMLREGRIVDDPTVAYGPWSTNIVPRQMTREQLWQGTQWLCKSLYAPAAFAERVVGLIKHMGERRDPQRVEGGAPQHLRAVETDGAALVSQISQMGRAEEKMLARIIRALAKRPDLHYLVMETIGQYAQIRYLYEYAGIWAPQSESRRTHNAA